MPKHKWIDRHERKATIGCEVLLWQYSRIPLICAPFYFPGHHIVSVQSWCKAHRLLASLILHVPGFYISFLWFCEKCTINEVLLHLKMKLAFWQFLAFSFLKLCTPSCKTWPVVKKIWLQMPINMFTATALFEVSIPAQDDPPVGHLSYYMLRCVMTQWWVTRVVLLWNFIKVQQMAPQHVGPETRIFLLFVDF